MNKAMRVFIWVVMAITCFDILAWFGKLAGKTVIKAQRERAITERALGKAAATVNAYIRERKRIPRKFSEVIRNGTVPTDAWHNKLRLEKTDGGVQVVSAGPDGDFETDVDNMRSEPQNGSDN